MSHQNLPLETARVWRQKAVWLDQFAAPAFSGIAFVSAICDIGRHDWAAGIFPLACVLSYWSRMVYLFWKEMRCVHP